MPDAGELREPLTQEAQAGRIELKTPAADAIRRLEDSGAANRALTGLREPLEELVEDEDFWAEQARSLAVFALPEGVRTFRLPNRLTHCGGRAQPQLAVHRRRGREGAAAPVRAQGRSGAAGTARRPADALRVPDEIARRVILNGGRVLAVRRDDLPDDTPVAAILRHRL